MEEKNRGVHVQQLLENKRRSKQLSLKDTDRLRGSSAAGNREHHTLSANQSSAPPSPSHHLSFQGNRAPSFLCFHSESIRRPGGAERHGIKQQKKKKKKQNNNNNNNNKEKRRREGGCVSELCEAAVY
ncbi:uncharacterized protein V6R79_017876 [Siganus canaliculatus]